MLLILFFGTRVKFATSALLLLLLLLHTLCLYAAPGPKPSTQSPKPYYSTNILPMTVTSTHGSTFLGDSQGIVNGNYRWGV